MPENTPKNINDAVGKIEQPLRPENIDKLDSAVARDNLDYGIRSKEFEKLRDAQSPAPSDDDNPPPVLPPAQNDRLDKFYNDIDEKKRDQIQSLINIVFEKGPEEGVLAARRSGDPYVIDELEKLLTMDWMHQILLERGLIQDLK